MHGMQDAAPRLGHTVDASQRASGYATQRVGDEEGHEPAREGSMTPSYGEIHALRQALTEAQRERDYWRHRCTSSWHCRRRARLGDRNPWG